MSRHGQSGSIRIRKLFASVGAEVGAADVIADNAETICRRLGSRCRFAGILPQGQCIARPSPCKYAKHAPNLTTEEILLAEKAMKLPEAPKKSTRSRRSSRKTETAKKDDASDSKE